VGEATAVRLANVQAYKEAVVQIQQLWCDKYTGEWTHATTKQTESKGFELVKGRPNEHLENSILVQGHVGVAAK
jgi:hypothetical protein